MKHRTLFPLLASASVAQDLEPEFITISEDSKTAWVTCQENNASAKVTKLTGLGYKEHGAGDTAAIYSFDPTALPSVGTTLAGQEIALGGFSGLHFEGIDRKTGRYKFVANTDRGPNAEPTGIIRPFLLPNFAPEIVRFELDPKKGKLTLTGRIALQRAPGQPLPMAAGLRLSLGGSSICCGRIVFTFVRVCQVLFVAPHPASRRRSYFKFSAWIRSRPAGVSHSRGLWHFTPHECAPAGALEPNA